jgi:uncharacterized protein (TIGR02118 family)
MTVISVFYPAADDARFDFGYYMGTHIPLVQRLWSDRGLQEVRVLKGSAGLGGTGPAYLLVALLTFESVEAFQAAAAEHGGEIFADIPNFTDTSPVLQLNELLG